MRAKDLLEFGVKYPYDADDSGATRQGDWADKVARGIIADLTDRRDIKHGFNRVDHDIRCEIVETLASIVREGAVDLLIEHDRYKAALEQYSNKECWNHRPDLPWQDVWMATDNGYDIARNALELEGTSHD